MYILIPVDIFKKLRFKSSAWGSKNIKLIPSLDESYQQKIEEDSFVASTVLTWHRLEQV